MAMLLELKIFMSAANLYLTYVCIVAVPCIENNLKRVYNSSYDCTKDCQIAKRFRDFK